MSLTAELANFEAEARKRIPAEALAVMDKAADEIAKSGIADKAIKVGDKAPDFELTNATGKTVKLSDLLSKGPVVLSYYRGVW